MSEDLINFVNPKNGIYYKTLKEIELFLMIRYGVSPNSYFYDFRFNENGFTKSYCADLNYRYQIEIRPELDFYHNPKINYDYGFPIIFHKILFDEKISYNDDEEKKFEYVLSTFENIIKNRNNQYECIS